MRRALAAVAAVLVLAACGTTPEEDDRGLGDAPVGDVHKGPAEVITFPDQVGNVFSKCDGHGHRVYSNTHYTEASSMAVIADPSCPGGEPK